MHAVIETHFGHPVVLGQELVKLKHTTFRHRRLVALCSKIIPIVSLDAASYCYCQYIYYIIYIIYKIYIFDIDLLCLHLTRSTC